MKSLHFKSIIRILSTLKRYLCTVVVFLCFYSICYSQQQLQPNRLSNFLDKHLPDSHVVLAGEGTFSTYGAGISFPVFWIEERVKMIPLFGFMWQNFIADGFNSRSAAGVKFLFYFKKQPFDLAPMNTFYSGIGGMSTISNFFGSTVTEYSRVGAILGYDFVINQSVQLAPELLLGVNETGGFRVEIGFVLHFGR